MKVHNMARSPIFFKIACICTVIVLNNLASTRLLSVPNDEIEVALFEQEDYDNKEESRFEKDEPFWVPFTFEEQQSISKYNDSSSLLYEHCQIGQGRKANSKCDFDQMLWKWNEDRKGAKPLANVTDLLDHLEERKIYPRKSCNVMFVGDSLSADHAMALNCQALSLGYKLKSCHIPAKNAKYGVDSQRVCERQDHKFQHFTLERDHGSCKKLFIGTVSPTSKGYHDTLSALARSRTYSNGMVVVYNWAVHCNTRNGCLKPVIEDTLLPYVNRITMSNFWKRYRFKNWIWLYREHEPQHFSTSNGLYQNTTATWRKKCSRALVKPDNWRNEEVRQLLKNYGVSKRVPIIPIFHALEPLWWMHAAPDCTHYCYTPKRFDVTWDGIIKALLTFENVD